MQLNQCRLFLKIHFLSEIVNSSGTQLLPGFWTGNITLRPAPPIHRYPRQELLSPPIWQLWRATIRRCFCNPSSTILRCPLGPWLPTSYHRFPAITLYPIRLWYSNSYFYMSYSSPTHISRFYEPQFVATRPRQLSSTLEK